jgi:superfamily II DNA/RNA helicase
MDAFQTRENVVSEYRDYISSFLSIADERIKDEVAKSFKGNGFILEPLIQFNPSFQKGESLEDLERSGEIHTNVKIAFGKYNLYKHQIEALRIGMSGKGFVVTSGTGSGKSLTYLATIFNSIFQKGATKSKGVKAILVYPMNALINSQEEEIKKYAENFGGSFPISFAKYTGQEGQDHRDMVKNEQPDIILTNYMMLELIMTRQSESWMRDSMKENLEFLVFDELHTYRGRQGSDVSLLVRRIKSTCIKEFVCIGTSATMSSDGTPFEKKQKVAKVATTIFGATYSPMEIIGEYLETCTNGKTYTPFELRNSIDNGIDSNGDEQMFVNHPLTNWLELKIALKDNSGTLERGKPRTLSEIAIELKRETEHDQSTIEKTLKDLLRWTEQLNEKNRLAGSRKSFLPFRFHQFISQTSTVSVTLESRSQRHITIKPGRYVKNEGDEKLLYPVLFSRYSGVDFLCVKKDVKKKTLQPRNPTEPIDPFTMKDAKGDNLKEEKFSEGYLILDEGEDFWKEDPIEIAPPEWLNTSETEFKPVYNWLMPKQVYFKSTGEYSENPDFPLKGWFIPVKLRIDPTAGIIYEDSKINESTKLMSLGNEGRSTATTIMSYAVVSELFKQKESVENQKLLSFTDNRQDASLQAGHFNDFLSSVRLRSGLHFALENNTSALDVHTIADRVFEELKLKETDYAKEPSTNPKYPDEDNERALKTYLLYRIFQDLKRGWRYTLPNLEQTALLKIEYKNLKKLSADDDEFNSIPFLNQRPASERYEILTQLLNFFRTNYALNHRILLDNKSESQILLKDKLDSKKLWSLDHNETFDAPTFMVSVRPGRSTQKGIYFASMGSRSNIGKYFKRKMQEAQYPVMSKDEFKEFIEMLCDKLKDVNILSKKVGLLGSSGTINGYLLKTDYILWLPGDGETVEIDKTRFNTYRNLELKPNRYFQKLYKTDFSKYSKEIIGREHTGQLTSADRIEREEQFRKGIISTMFCSPTMELGIDIANLNIVHMRNVPPNPANYAQRSGRAGRSGQTAVVFTYCSAWSPHDQNYFNAADTMVAGSVAAPRIDLKNEELLTSHFNAYLLMELGIRELHSSVADILDLSNPADIHVKDTIITSIENNLNIYKNTWIQSFKRVAVSMEADLKETWWYTEDWYIKKVDSFINRFKAAFKRWISLYSSAMNMLNRAHVVQQDPTLKSDSPQKKEANTQYAVAKKQLALLKNDSNQSISNESEFYIFRYLASEGFLPGYNFTRLPVRTFIGYKHNDQGEYISRPRSVALKEFGPMNIIYHNGSKYRINRMSVLEAESLQRKAKISTETGYAFLDDDAETANVDPITRKLLKNDTNSLYRTTLIELSESEGIPQERISCIEEERSSSGYEITEYFRYPQGIDSTKNATIQSGGVDLMNMIYGQSTELIKVNWRSKRSPSEGFAIDKRNGKWLSQKDLENQETADNKKDVLVFVRDTADTLYVQPLSSLNLTPDQVTSLSYAIKRGIERLFQVEENEIGVRVMGTIEKPNILIYEASEGSLGILSQLIQEPVRMKDLFTESYRCMHFDPETKEETELGKSLPKASYQDLLSYYNQRDHEILDRREIKKVLEQLMECDFSPNQGTNNYESQYKYLLDIYDRNSATEKPFIEFLYKNRLSLPDKAQVNMKDFYINVDFVYNSVDGPVLVFCDGSIHDEANIMAEDDHKRQLLKDEGYDIVVWHYGESLNDLVERRKDIFRKVI